MPEVNRVNNNVRDINPHLSNSVRRGHTQNRSVDPSYSRSVAFENLKLSYDSIKYGNFKRDRQLATPSTDVMTCISRRRSKPSSLYNA